MQGPGPLDLQGVLAAWPTGSAGDSCWASGPIPSIDEIVLFDLCRVSSDSTVRPGLDVLSKPYDCYAERIVMFLLVPRKKGILTSGSDRGLASFALGRIPNGDLIVSVC